jgi:ATP-binding cassette subfamily B protein
MNRLLWGYFTRFYAPARLSLAWCGILAVAQSFLVLPVAFVLRYIFDVVIPARDFRDLVGSGVVLLLLHLGSNGINLLVKRKAVIVTKTAIRDLRDHALQRVYVFPRNYYSRVDSSRIHATIVHDSDRVDGMSDALVAFFLPASVTTLVLAVVLVYLNWMLFLVLSACVPVLLFAHHRMKRGLIQRAESHHQAFREFSRGMLFVLQRLEFTKLHTAENVETRRQGRQHEELRRVGTALRTAQAAYNSTQQAMLAIASVLILIVGGGSVAAGAMTFGELISFYVVVGLLTNHVRQALSAIPQVISGRESLVRLFELVGNEQPSVYDGRRRLAFHGEIALDSVWFQYQEQGLLEDISLTVKPGRIVVVAGPNGSGKTTLVNLLLGLYRPRQGSLFADGHPYSELDLAHLRRSIAVVTQEPVIFPGTILENLTYGSPHAAFDRVVVAAELATAHEFVMQLPDGYDTFVGDNGTLLSGGQRQRLAIARALLRESRLLILDEPTNHIDAVAAAQLVRNLKKLNPAPSILIVTHSSEIFREVEDVFVLPEGRWVASWQYQQETYGEQSQTERRLLADAPAGASVARSVAAERGSI